MLPRARMPSKVPVVLTVADVRTVLDAHTGVPKMVAMLLYGAGLRLQECLELRVKVICGPDLAAYRSMLVGLSAAHPSLATA